MLWGCALGRLSGFIAAPVEKLSLNDVSPSLFSSGGGNTHILLCSPATVTTLTAPPTGEQGRGPVAAGSQAAEGRRFHGGDGSSGGSFQPAAVPVDYPQVEECFWDVRLMSGNAEYAGGVHKCSPEGMFSIASL